MQTLQLAARALMRQRAHGPGAANSCPRGAGMAQGERGREGQEGLLGTGRLALWLRPQELRFLELR